MSESGARQGKLLRLEAKMQPGRIRSTLAFAGLYQITHEMIKWAVVDDLAGFYGKNILNGTWMYGEDNYKQKVLALSRKGAFKSSLMWLVSSEAITQEQADRLDVIYDHRHDLTHELIKYVVDLAYEPDADLFFEALAILADLKRFWTQIEKDVGTFEEFGDIDVDEVMPLNLMVLQRCIDAYVGGLSTPKPG